MALRGLGMRLTAGLRGLGMRLTAGLHGLGMRLTGGPTKSAILSLCSNWLIL